MPQNVCSSPSFRLLSVSFELQRASQTQSDHQVRTNPESYDVLLLRISNTARKVLCARVPVTQNVCIFVPFSPLSSQPARAPHCWLVQMSFSSEASERKDTAAMWPYEPRSFFFSRARWLRKKRRAASQLCAWRFWFPDRRARRAHCPTRRPVSSVSCTCAPGLV